MEILIQFYSDFNLIFKQFHMEKETIKIHIQKKEFMKSVNTFLDYLDNWNKKIKEL